MHAFLKDQTIWRNDREFRVGRALNGDEVQLEAVLTGEISTHKVFNLLTEYTEGSLLTSGERRKHLRCQPTRRKPARMDGMSGAAKSETRRRMDYLVRLEHMGSFGKPKKELVDDLRVISAVRQEARPPHQSTVYRWRRRYLRARRDVRALFCQFEKQGGKGQTRLDPEVEAIIHHMIEKVFLVAKKGSAEDVHNAVFLEIQRRNTELIESEWLKVPGLRTIQRRIAQLYAFELAVARYGEREAERRFANHLGARKVSRILEMVEIDHSPVDLMVTDEKRVVIARPTITVVLCRRSRCVLGYHLSLAGHGVPAVFAAIRHALLPKTYLTDRYADLHLTWDCFGWFEVALMDNGSEFHADAVRDALANIGVITEFAEARNPNDKPHVERFLKTFNYSFIHKLPGTTLAKVHQRIGFKAEADACITLEELDRMIHVWICQVYHLRPHAGLDDRAPMTVWEEGAAACPPQLKMNREDVDIEFSQLAESALQHYGIDLNTFVYVSTRLLTLRRMLPENPKVTVKWPDHDAGVIFVWDPFAEDYFAVPNKETEYAGLTVEQAKLAKKAKAAGDPSYRQTNATGQAIVRAMVDEALSDKALKNRRQGARLDNQTSEQARHGVSNSERATTEHQAQDTAAPDAAVGRHDEVDVEVEGMEA
jgi:putative transposase